MSAFGLTDETVLHASYNHFFVPPPIEGVLSSERRPDAID